MQKIGHSITQVELDNIMAEHDIEKNGVISYKEFKYIFLDIQDQENLSWDYKSWLCLLYNIIQYKNT